MELEYSVVLEKLHKIGLGPWFRWFVNNNPSNYNPYHNLNHTMQMLSMIMKLDKNNTFPTHLYMAGLFHDFGHTGGKEKDDVNVKLAIEGWLRAASELKPDIGDVYKDNVVQCIQATEYPYTIPDQNLSKDQKIIRDCDILVCLFSDFLVQNMMGLEAEMGIDHKTYLEMEKKFISSQIFSLRSVEAKELMTRELGNLVLYIDRIERMLG